MHKSWLLTAVVLALALTLAHAAPAASSFKAKPFEFVGTAAECGGPAGTDTVTAAWVTHQGLPDAGTADHALLLEKLGATPNCAAAGAIIDGAGGITLTELGFDYRNGGHCGAGAPRYNVTTTAPDDPVHWTRVRYGADVAENGVDNQLHETSETAGRLPLRPPSLSQCEDGQQTSEAGNYRTVCPRMCGAKPR